MEEKISVIVPVYMVEAYLDECVRSIVGQTYGNLEILLVDDGSPDGCPAICDAWAERDPRIRVIHKENGGLSDARNAGIDAAQGDYIAFVDSDDWIEPTMYETMLAALKKEDADICACGIASCYLDHRKNWGCPKYMVSGPEQTLKMLYHDTAFPVSAWNKLYRRSCWDGMRFPVGKICEDAFTTYLLVHNARRIVQIPYSFYCYRIRPQSIMTSPFSPRRMDEEEAWRLNYEFVKEYYPRLYRKAFSFYLQSVHVIIHQIDHDQKAVYKKEYSYLRTVLMDNLWFMMIQSTVSIKYRVKYLLDLIKLEG